MTPQLFDTWTRRLASASRSRRGVLHLALGAGVAGAASASLPDSALACRKDGGKCQRDGQCCSGKCKRKANKGIGACKRVRSAFGCTVKQDICREESGEDQVSCPGRPDGFCVRLENGRPFCARDGDCAECETDADCTRLGNGARGHCITNCRPCRGETNGRACVYARFVDGPPAENTSAGGSRLD